MPQPATSVRPGPGPGLVLPGDTPRIRQIDALLPQTQCRQCGYQGCLPYARAIATGEAPINRCPPGGGEGIAALAALTGAAPLALDAQCGVERPLRVALIDEARCIGCTLCIQACPVDAIVGAVKRMHTVLAAHCTGCDLCLPPCPMDCIAMVAVDPPRAWTRADADDARTRLATRLARLAREAQENDARLAAKALRKIDEVKARSDLADSEKGWRLAVIEKALARARLRHAAPEAPAPGDTTP